MANLIKMSPVDYMAWQVFLSNTNDTLSKAEQELLAKLHSKYYNHSYYIPCTCNPKVYNTWIEQLNTVFNRGL